MRVLISLLVACSLLGACVSQGARPSEVEARIAEFLIALRDRAEGMGWDHLRGDVRASYPGGQPAWIQAMRAADTGRLSWRIEGASVDDFVGCARVVFGDTAEGVPSALFDDQLPPAARVASRIDDAAFLICATTGPLPLDAGVHGVG